MNAKIRNIDVYHVRNFTRLAANFNLANDLLEDALFLAYADGLADQMQRHRNFNLLPLDQSDQIGVDKPAAHRVDLTFVKHHFAGSDAFNVEREDRVAARFGTK